MPIDTGMYALSNQVNPVKIADEGQQLGTNIAENQYKMQNLGMQTEQAKQAFQDSQSVRQAMKQNVDALGNLNKHAAIVQIAQQNPILAKQTDMMMNKYGVEGAAQHAERMQQFWANVTPESFMDEKKKLLNEGFEEAGHLPDVLTDSMRLRGMAASGSASQQMDMIKAQAHNEMEMNKSLIENGRAPLNNTLRDIYGMRKEAGQEAGGVPSSGGSFGGATPGSPFTMGKIDLKGQEVANEELKARGAHPDFQTARNNLLAIKNAQSLINAEKDPDKITTAMIPLLAAEAAKVTSGKAPTEEELHSMTPQNRNAKMAQMFSWVSGKPEPANQGQFINQMNEYLNELKQNSVDVVKSAHEAAIGAGVTHGMTSESAARMKAVRDKELSQLTAVSKPKGQMPAMSPQDKAAVDWARKNPSSPHAKEILKANGVEK